MAEGTRQRILDAAERVIRKHGLVGATTRLIAKEAECAEGTLYVHFPNREELFLALLDEKLPSLTETIFKLTDRVGKRTIRANLADVAHAALAFFDTIMPIMGALFGEPPLLAAYREMLRSRNRGPHRGIEAIVGYLTAEQRLGRVDEDADLAGAAEIVLGVPFFHEFLAKFSGTGRPPSGADRFVESATLAAWSLLAPGRPERARGLRAAGKSDRRRTRLAR